MNNFITFILYCVIIILFFGVVWFMGAGEMIIWFYSVCEKIIKRFSK